MPELVETYCNDTQQLLDELRSNLSNQDAEAFRRTAHSIKSSSASLGAFAYAALARELEMLGKSGDLSTAHDKVDQLVAQYLPVRNALMELKNEL